MLGYFIALGFALTTAFIELISTAVNRLSIIIIIVLHLSSLWLMRERLKSIYRKNPLGKKTCKPLNTYTFRVDTE